MSDAHFTVIYVQTAITMGGCIKMDVRKAEEGETWRGEGVDKEQWNKTTAKAVLTMRK